MRSYPQRQNHITRIIIISLVCLSFSGAVIGCGASSSTSGSHGFYNMTTLETDLRTKVTEKLDKLNEGKVGSEIVTVAELGCIRNGNQTAECNVGFSNGAHQSDEVTIASDGNSYISH
jgi:hypothetical protein